MLKDLRTKDQADMAQRIDDAKETTIDKTLYRVWSTNPGVLNLSFLREELELTLAWWNTWLEQEAEDTITDTVDSDEGEEGESIDLKYAQARLDALRE